MASSQGNQPTILVSGATGRQGGSVLRHLLKNNFTVKALTRTPGSLAAGQLAAAGVTIVKGDMSDPSSLITAMTGCDGVFSVQNYFEYGGDNEILYGKNMADAAMKSGVSCFIYSSVCNANTNSGVPHFETKYVIEQYIRSLDLPAVILRPVKFMENYYILQVFKGILNGKLFDSIKAGKKHQLLNADDIGKYAVSVFANPQRYLGHSFPIAGDELTNEEISATMAEVLGHPVKFKRLPLFVVKLAMDKELYLMFKWFNEKGFTADRAQTKEDFPNVTTTSLKQFLLNENWQRWNVKGSV